MGSALCCFYRAEAWGGNVACGRDLIRLAMLGTFPKGEGFIPEKKRAFPFGEGGTANAVTDEVSPAGDVYLVS